MRSGVATRLRGVPGSPQFRRGAIVAGLVVLFLLAVAFGARDAVESAYLQHVVAGELDGDVSIGSLQHRDGATVLDGVRIATRRGTILSADRVTYRVQGDRWEVSPVALHVTVPRATLFDSDLPRLVAAAHDLGIGRAVVHLRAAGLDLTTDNGTTAVEIAGITGDLAAGPVPAYRLTATFVDRVAPLGADPIVATTATVAGRAVHTISAGAVPLGGIGTLLGGDGVTFSGGRATGVQISDDGGWHATMTIAGATVNLGTVSLTDIAGPLTLVPHGLGSAGLDATLMPAGVPMALTGEVHDLADPEHGSRDLRMLGDMVTRIGTQPNLRWTNVETTAPGIVYGQFAMTTKYTPHVVQLLAIDPREPTVRFDTALADDHIISTGARTTDLGLRTNAVAGVNGDYFDIGRTYEPQGLLIRSGALLHGPTDHEALIVDRANHFTFARFRLHGIVKDGERSYPVTLFNSWPTRDVTVITPDYGPKIPAAAGVTFVALEPVSGTQYRVTSLQRMDGGPIPTVLGIGISDLVHRPLPQVGDLLDITYSIDPPTDGAVAGIGSGPLLLKDGKWFEDKHAPAPDERDVQWPVVAAGTMADGTVMLAAVDGRHPERSIGMTRPEFAELLRGLGVTDAMALDSGGSVTMVARSPGAHAVTLHNVPSDNSYERYVSDAFFVYSSAPEGTIVTEPRPHVEPSPVAK